MITPEMKIEQIETAKLIPYARNAKAHTEAQVAKIAGSIREFGFNAPVLIDANNTIIAGHGRVLAAQLLTLEKVPCVRISHLTETQRRAYCIADNRLGEVDTSWDNEMLGLELSDLREVDFDLDLTGFDAAAIEAMLNPPEVESPDDFGEVDENIATEHECPKCGYTWSGKSGKGDA